MSAPPDFVPGDAVRMTADSFQGQYGIIKAVQPERRLALVAVRAYGTTIALEIDFDTIEKCDPVEVPPLSPAAPEPESPPDETPARAAMPKIPIAGPADRVVFVCHQGGHGFSVGVALHRGGRQALEYLRQAASGLRRGDPAASAARLCGTLHAMLEGNRHLTLHPPPRVREDGSVDWKAYSQGDAGVVLLDVANGSIECHAGYLAGPSTEGLALGDGD